MKFYLDTAIPEEVEKGFQTGLIDGVTTNPALLSKQSLTYKEGVQKVVELTKGATVFAEVLAEDPDEMVKEAKEINTWGPDMIIKLPMTPAGIIACRRLTSEGISCAITMVYTTAQALVAAKAGAKYVAAFIARANEVGVSGLQTVADIEEAFSVQGIETKILGASLRNAQDAADCLKYGAEAVTLPLAVFEGMMKNPMTNLTLDNFVGQWKEKNQDGIF